MTNGGDCFTRDSRLWPKTLGSWSTTLAMAEIPWGHTDNDWQWREHEKKGTFMSVRAVSSFVKYLKNMLMPVWTMFLATGFQDLVRVKTSFSLSGNLMSARFLLITVTRPEERRLFTPFRWKPFCAASSWRRTGNIWPEAHNPIWWRDTKSCEVPALWCDSPELWSIETAKSLQAVWVRTWKSLALCLICRVYKCSKIAFSAQKVSIKRTWCEGDIYTKTTQLIFIKAAKNIPFLEEFCPLWIWNNFHFAECR